MAAAPCSDAPFRTHEVAQQPACTWFQTCSGTVAAVCAGLRAAGVWSQVELLQLLQLYCSQTAECFRLDIWPGDD